MTKAYHTPGIGTLQLGSVVATMQYDGLGRRIVKAVQNSGPLDCTYHYYYNGQQMVETRNGSDLTIKQNVWGLTYIDELVQTSLNDDPTDLTEQLCESNFYALQDANYNVLGILDEVGILTERYEYTPYGERQVYTSAGPNDPACMTPTLLSQRQNLYIWTLGDPEELIAFPQPYGLNDVGHQGLMHDEELSPKHQNNRARYRTDRFLQRDPLGYVDGMSLYQHVNSNPLLYMDPSGFIGEMHDPRDVGGISGPGIPLLPVPPKEFSPHGIPYMPPAPMPPFNPPSPPMTITDLLLKNPISKVGDTGILIVTLVIAEICATPAGVSVEIIKIIPGVVMPAPLDETTVWDVVYDAFSGQIREVWIEK